MRHQSVERLTKLTNLKKNFFELLAQGALLSLTTLHSLKKPGSGKCPPTRRGGSGNIQCFCGFVFRQTDKIAQANEFRFGWLLFFKRTKRLMDG